MSKYFSGRFEKLTPYVPGEQPRDRSYIKLNTNENPFPPAPGVKAALEGEWEHLQLYSDPECTALRNTLGAYHGVSPEQIIVTNGSDEVLNFAFMAFSDADRPVVFPDITYGFYRVFAKLHRIPFQEIPLNGEFRIDPEDYCGIGKNIVIANPNAPTGAVLSLTEIERIVATNPENVVVIDEAYVDFGGDSAISLVEKYENLLVTRTFSKSRSMAGARLGYGIAQSGLIRDLNTIRYSTNPYNVNRMTEQAGIASVKDEVYFRKSIETVKSNRKLTGIKLKEFGFTVLPSSANFLFAGHCELSGRELYAELKSRGILVRHFSNRRIENFVRITIGSQAEMMALLDAIGQILEEIT